MTRRSIRASVIPDDSVKILDLCLTSEENGIVISVSRSKNDEVNFFADSALKNLIATKIADNNFQIPLTMRKRLMYERAKKANISKKIVDEFLNFCNYNKISIIMRKYLSCMQLQEV